MAIDARVTLNYRDQEIFKGEVVMTILVATDFSENAKSAVRVASLLSQRFDEPLTLMHAVDFAGDDNAWRVLYETADEIESAASKEANEELKKTYEAAVPESERTSYTTVVRFGQPAEAIIEEAEARKPGFIVAGTVGESRLQHLFFGRTTNHLVRETKVPVLAVPPLKSVEPFKRILFATDFSAGSEAALKHAKSLADRFGAELHVMHAVDVDHEVVRPSLGALMADIRPHVDALVASQKEELAALGVEHSYVEVGRPDATIKKLAAKLDADLIVMGTHGRKGFARWFLGSTAERVLRNSEIPVLVVS